MVMRQEKQILRCISPTEIDKYEFTVLPLFPTVCFFPVDKWVRGKNDGIRVVRISAQRTYRCEATRVEE